MLKIYTIFHLNLAYSSIKEKQRSEVIQRCYWPLLELADSIEIPLGIELSGYTLEQIRLIDSAWIRKARSLLQQKRIEIIGSGYCQIIGPLVPAKVNEYNQLFGLSAYKKILNHKPKLVLVNEQAYSCGLIPHYKKAGYKAIIMEWDNSYRFHQDWDKRWRYYPQRAIDNYRNSMPVIWNNAIMFQKFQRYAQGETGLEEYMDYLGNHMCPEEIVLSLYGNDAEVFDFRPGRFDTELKIHKDGEWNRINILFENLKKKMGISFILPSDTLKYLEHPLAGNPLHLESSEQPIPVKKQQKYNITRWAVTGRDDTNINSICYKIFSCLKGVKTTKENKIRLEKLWRNLCYLWSSDFRTHIEQKRWEKYNKDLRSSLIIVKKIYKAHAGRMRSILLKKPDLIYPESIISRKNNLISIETKKNRLLLNCNKGLAIDSLIFKDISPRPLIGTINHGYYDNIVYGADYFSGHTIIEEIGKRKVTDLETVEPWISNRCNRDHVLIGCIVKTNIGTIKKEIKLYTLRNQINITFTFDIQTKMPVSVRTGIITLLPSSFNKKCLYYKTINGGIFPEIFCLNNTLKHTEPIDRLISASHCLGATEGWIEIGDGDKYIRIATDKHASYSVPMVEYATISDSYFLRCLHSLKETDETSIGKQRINGNVTFFIEAGIRK